jgi:hypothetical protein
MAEREDFFRRIVFFNAHAVEMTRHYILPERRQRRRIRAKREAYAAIQISIDGKCCGAFCRWKVEDEDGAGCTLFRTRVDNKPKRLRWCHLQKFVRVRDCEEAHLYPIVFERPINDIVAETVHVEEPEEDHG